MITSINVDMKKIEFMMDLTIEELYMYLGMWTVIYFYPGFPYRDLF